MEEIATPDQGTVECEFEIYEIICGSLSGYQYISNACSGCCKCIENRLPALATVADQNRMFSQAKRELGESINWIDVTSSLKKHTDGEDFL